jgi:chromosome segregation ATPase
MPDTKRTKSDLLDEIAYLRAELEERDGLLRTLRSSLMEAQDGVAQMAVQLLDARAATQQLGALAAVLSLRMLAPEVAEAYLKVSGE